MKERIQLPDIHHCTGCQACRAVCPTNAISMQENEKGHIYPVINENLCISCNKCAKTCPEIRKVDRQTQLQKVIACWVNDKYNRKRSSSGGMSYIFSRKIVSEGGYFCGVVYQHPGAEHQICSNIDDLYKFQGSKYTHSDVKEVYSEINTLLKENKTVLFSGTPCQVAALRTYLHKPYPNLYCIDIICHGVPSRRLLRDRIKTVEAESRKRITEIRFRDKNPDQFSSCVRYTFDDDKNLIIPVQKEPYFRCFVTNYALRENCFNCQYSSRERVGDITLADFWSYNPGGFKYRSYKKGTSVMIINSAQGEELYKKVRPLLTVDEMCTIEQAAAGNHNLNAPQPKPEHFNEFWSRYQNGESLEALMPEYYPEQPIQRTSITKKIKMYIYLLIPKFIKKILKG